MYTEIGEVSAVTMSQLKGILDAVSKWETHVSDKTSHQAAICKEQAEDVDEIVARWPVDSWQQLLFLRLRPGGKLYRHHDNGFGFHIPVETNKDVVSLSFENGIRKEHHLQVGKIYHTDRSIEHQSFNNGKTSRTHLIVLLKEQDNG